MVSPSRTCDYRNDLAQVPAHHFVCGALHRAGEAFSDRSCQSATINDLQMSAIKRILQLLVLKAPDIPASGSQEALHYTAPLNILEGLASRRSPAVCSVQEGSDFAMKAVRNLDVVGLDALQEFKSRVALRILGRLDRCRRARGYFQLIRYVVCFPDRVE